MYGQDILCGISKVPFEIPHRISYPYIERYVFYTTLKFSELLDLRAHTHFGNAPLVGTWSERTRVQTPPDQNVPGSVKTYPGARRNVPAPT